MTTDQKITKDWQKIAEEEEVSNNLGDEQKDLDDDFGDADDELAASGEVLEHPSYKALEKKLTEEEAKSHEQWNRATRAVAELENLRPRFEKQIKDAKKYALEQFANALLPVADSLEQALQCVGDTAANNTQAMTQGIELTLKLFIDVLAKFDIKPLDPLGELFNPQLHEAMATQPNPQVPSGTVLTVFQKGYLLNDRLIRPARVIVAKN